MVLPSDYRVGLKSQQVSLLLSLDALITKILIKFSPVYPYHKVPSEVTSRHMKLGSKWINPTNSSALCTHAYVRGPAHKSESVFAVHSVEEGTSVLVLFHT